MTVIRNFPRVYFDFGAREALAEELSACGIERPLIITDPGVAACGVFDIVRKSVPETASISVFDQTPENPTLDGVESALEVYRAGGCDGVVAVGGGSVIDSAKALATLVLNPAPLRQYSGPGAIPPAAGAAPIIAIPTTAGTGSEVTRGAGIHPNAESRAFSAGGDHVLPKVAICDPELTLTLPPMLTAGTGMDALGHCIEGFLSPVVNPPVDAIALDGISRVVRHIERAVADGSDREARWHMAMAALEGGMAISKGLGSVHALANTFGDVGLHHGMLVTVSMPAVLRFLAPHVSAKTATLARAMDLEEGADVAKAVERLNDLVGLPANVRDLGYSKQDIDEMAEDAAESFFNGTCPKVPSREEYAELIRDALG